MNEPQRETLVALLQGSLGWLSPGGLAAVRTLAAAHGRLESARFVAARLGLRDRHQLARLLKRDGLPSLEDLAGWISVLNWVLGWEHRGASLFEQALTSGRDPATCYRLVKRITGATWITVRNHGSGWVVLQLRDRCVIPKPDARTAHQQDHGRAGGARGSA